MPRDANGNYSLPSSYFVQNGDTVLPVQHNPPLEDVAQALTNSLAKDGRTVMTGNLQMGGNRITDAAPGQSDSDIATVGQVGRKAAFKTVAALLADTTLSYSTGPALVSVGDIIEAQGFRYEVAPDEADQQTAGGVNLFNLKTPSGSRFHAEAWGLRTGSLNEDWNNSRIDDLLSTANRETCLIRFGEGDFYLGAVSYDWINGDQSRSEKGIVGTGLGSTTLNFANNPDTYVFGQADEACFFLTFRDAKFKHVNENSNVDFFMGKDDGTPHMLFRRLFLEYWRRCFEVHTWLSTFDQIEARHCKWPFSWYAGTSVRASNLYALGARSSSPLEYGYMIGCKIDNDGETFRTSGSLKLDYSSFGSIATDDPAKAGYVFGATRAVGFDGMGCERAGRNWLYFPEVIGKADENIFYLDGPEIGTFSVVNGNSDHGPIRLGRTHVGLRLHRGVIGSEYTKLFDYENGMSIDQPHGVEFGKIGWRRRGNGLSYNQSVDVKVAGKNIGAVTTMQDTTIDAAASRPGERVYETTIAVEGGDQLRLALSGAFSQGQGGMARVEMSPHYIGNGIASGPNVTIRIGMRSENNGEISTSIEGTNTGAVSVSVGDSVKNPGGRDVIITPSVPGENYICKVYLATNAGPGNALDPALWAIYSHTPS